MSIQELEEFFQNHTVPSGTKLNKATVIGDTKKYLEVNLNVLKSWPGDLNKCPSYWHLCDLVAIISGGVQEENPSMVRQGE
jgi:hypothetical protein